MPWNVAADHTGRRYGSWAVIARSHKNAWGDWYWMCECDCGERRPLRSSTLRADRSPWCASCDKKLHPRHKWVRWGEHVMSINEWAEALGHPRRRIYRRRYKNWSLAECFTQGTDPGVLEKLGVAGKEKPREISHWEYLAHLSQKQE